MYSEYGTACTWQRKSEIERSCRARELSILANNIVRSGRRGKHNATVAVSLNTYQSLSASSSCRMHGKLGMVLEASDAES